MLAANYLTLIDHQPFPMWFYLKFAGFSFLIANFMLFMAIIFILAAKAPRY